MGWVFSKCELITGKELWNINKRLFIKDNSKHIDKLISDPEGYEFIPLELRSINESTMRFFTKNTDKISYINYEVVDYKQLMLSLDYTSDEIQCYDLNDAKLDWYSDDSDDRIFYLEIYNKVNKCYEKIEVDEDMIDNEMFVGLAELSDDIYFNTVRHLPVLWYKTIQNLAYNSSFKINVFDFVKKAIGKNTLPGRYFNSFKDHRGKNIPYLTSHSIIIDNENIELFKQYIYEDVWLSIEDKLHLNPNEFILGSW